MLYTLETMRPQAALRGARRPVRRDLYPPDWLSQLEAYVQQRVSDPMLCVPDMARAVAMSESTLLRKLKRQTGLTPQQYVQQIRLEKARQLLECGLFDTVAEVAYRVGYGKPAAFSRVFRARFGQLPSALLNA